jgi:hypothetical protein
MRRGHGQRPPTCDVYSTTVDSYHDAPFNARMLDTIIYPSVVDRDDILQSDPIYCYHPSVRHDLQSPLALNPISPTHNPILVEK